jgi:hypothetical protein
MKRVLDLHTLFPTRRTDDTSNSNKKSGKKKKEKGTALGAILYTPTSSEEEMKDSRKARHPRLRKKFKSIQYLLRGRRIRLLERLMRLEG